jgi:two-component system sensor histidine kinase YesM
VLFGGLLTMDMGLDYFNNILLNSKLTPGSLTFVMDRGGKILICPDETVLGTEFGSIEGKKLIYSDEARQFGSYIGKQAGTSMLVSYQKLTQPDWTIVSLTPMSELNGELATLNRVMLFVIAICGAIAVIVALLLADNVSYPIRKLVKSMGEVQKGNFEIAPEYRRNDEFAYLFTSFRKMVGEIRELIDKLYVSEVKKKEAELKSLQAQINPHFLYNTLDSVNWMALELNAANISTMVTSLSDFFRYSLSKGKSVITIGDEKMQVESYLRIQKIRFEDKLDYLLDLPAEILEFLTVKLILQPLVENSILHGINKKPGKGHITVTAEKKDSLIVIRIRDDGAGADTEELNAILDNRSGKSSFAIKNVDERIKHTFGDCFGLRYFGNEDGGVTVEVRFPAVKTMEGMHVENDIGG